VNLQSPHCSLFVVVVVVGVFVSFFWKEGWRWFSLSPFSSSTICCGVLEIVFCREFFFYV
jgi:hypothetical protein